MKPIKYLILLLIALFTPTSFSQQAKDFGQYEVHYNALNTNLIPAEVAQGYRIQRSGNRVMLNITVLDKATSENGERASPTHAEVSATAVNLNGQLRKIKMREITDNEGAVYYIGDLRVDNQETLKFTVEVKPAAQEEAFTLVFQQQFFTQ